MKHCPLKNQPSDSNQGIHIIGLLLFMLLQIVYNTIAVQTLWDVFEYLRQRTIFMYNQERSQVHQYFLWETVSRIIKLLLLLLLLFQFLILIEQVLVLASNLVGSSKVILFKNFENL